MRSLIRSLAFLALGISTSISTTQAQKPADQSDEVVRIKSELVRSDVTVVDKQGRFVDGLTPDLFELRVDGRVQPITFFERVTSGTAEEQKQLTRSRNRTGTKTADITGPVTTKNTADRNRVIFFFIDDVHLGNESLGRTRASLLRFVDKQMTDNDRVAIVSTSGQIGFLQQLTDNKAVLREAIDRLHFKRNIESVSMKVPISDVDANLVGNHRDVRLFQYLVEATQNEFQTDAFNAYLIVKQRVRQINAQSRPIENYTLLGLENLMRSSAPLIGRKLVFFVSDGFIVDVKKSNAQDILREVINEAARVGAVVYTMDSRTTFSDPAVDASQNGYLDFSSRQGGRLLSESKMPQEPLETLAEETGGRAFLKNDFEDALGQAIRETSDYYLLDWRPDSDTQRNGKARLEVAVKGRPELRVRVRRHIVDLKADETAEAKKKQPIAVTSPEDELRQTLGSLYPHRDLPISLSAGFIKTSDNSLLLNVTMQLDGAALNFDPTEQFPEGKKESEVDVLGVALDDRGSFASFKQKLTVTKDAVFSNGTPSIQWSQLLPLPPGLYQVRVAVRERTTGRTGSAMQWLEIPKIAAGDFAISSIFLGGRKSDEASPAQRVAIKVDHRFTRNSRLRFQVYLYNAKRPSDTAEPTIEVKVLQSDRVVFNQPVTQLVTNGTSDPNNMVVSGEINAEQFAPGQYTLQISVASTTSKANVIQQLQFVIE